MNSDNMFSQDAVDNLVSMLCPQDADTAPLPPSVTPATLMPGGPTKNSITKPFRRVENRAKERAEQHKAEEKRMEDEDNIWKDGDLSEGVKLQELPQDDRLQPEYEILSRQKVSAEDVFFGLSDVSPGSDHCSEYLVKVWLPETNLKDITLDVTKERMIVQTVRFKLNLRFPYWVKEDGGKAEWDKSKGLLSLRVPIDARVQYIDVSGSTPNP
eukprot:GDKH01021442.1.p1 GENE.GDKH01021442.1~~GDKH01021442.1.p1  ORF type:complete len:213 (+),score=24.81 GDKH01021442.1:124-762(+)